MTPQYAGLRTLSEKYADQGLSVLGFPCNQFGKQEPGTNEEIAEFASSKFGVKFPMFAKIEVNGDGAADLYKWLKTEAPGDEGKTDVPWNFTKFLVNKDGQVVKRYGPQVTPEEIDADLPNHL